MSKFLSKTLAVLAGVIFLVSANSAQADERYFTYVYDASVLPEGEWEFEQWVTNQNGKEDGDYSEWNLRTEFEYGLTSNWMGAFYLNLDSVRADGVPDEESDTEFKGVSLETVYQLLNPNIDPVGLAAYFEVSSDGIDWELEPKLLISKPIGNWNLAFNAIYEMEWEREDNRTEKEATLEFTAGAAYKVTPKWSVGVEARNKSAYPDGLNLGGQEFQSWSVGPNVHYGTPKWWATLTVLPQVWGNGDGSEGSRQLVHEEALETRLIFGIFF